MNIEQPNKQFATIIVITLLSFLSTILLVSLSQYKLVMLPLGVLFIGFIVFIILYLEKLTKVVAFMAIFNIILLAIYYPIVGIFLNLGIELVQENIKFISGFRPLILNALLLLSITFFLFRLNMRAFLLTILAVGFLGLNFLLSPAPIQARAIYLLNSFLPFYLFPILIIIFIKNIQVDSHLSFYKKNIFWIILLIISMGVLFWISIGFSYDIFRPDLVSSIRSRDGIPIDYGEFPGSWSSRIGEMRFTRIPGTFADPIQWGYFLMFATILSFYYFRTIFLSFVLIFLLLFSGAKGAMLFLISASLLYLVYKKMEIFFKPAFIIWASVILFAVSYFNTSGLIHMEGLIGGTKSILVAPIHEMLMGYGLGSGGNMLSIANPDSFSKDLWLETGAESGFGTLIYQTGIIGVLLIFLIIRELFLTIFESKNLSLNLKKYLISILLVYYTIFFIQENLLNVSFVGMLFMVIVFLIIGDVEKMSGSNNKNNYK